MALKNIAHIGDHRDGAPQALAGVDHLQTEEKTFFQPRGINDTQHVLHVWISERLIKMPNGEALLLRDRSQGVGARKIHQVELR